ncbi:hypothetical protein C0J50_9259, partial [Silurus asotus]
LKVTVSDWTDQYMELSCNTTCTLSNNPTYIWYKNGQWVNECKSASCSVAAVSDSPKNTRAVVHPSGDLTEGISVTLSCSSDADPVHTYSWFKQRDSTDTLLTTSQNYSISNIITNHNGLYYCTAHNQLGQQHSTPVHLNVLGFISEGSENNTVLKFSVVGLVVFLAVTLLSGALWMWKRKSSSANKHSSTAEGEQ